MRLKIVRIVAVIRRISAQRAMVDRSAARSESENRLSVGRGFRRGLDIRVGNECDLYDEGFDEFGVLAKREGIGEAIHPVRAPMLILSESSHFNWTRRMDCDSKNLSNLPLAVARYRNYLKMLAAVRLGSVLQARMDESDLVQDTLLEATRDWHQFRGQTEQELLSWLKTILLNNVNRTITHHVSTQKRSLGRETSLHELTGLHWSSEALDNAIVSQVGSPDESANQHELLIAVADCIAELSEEQREALLLRSFQGKKYSEMATLTNRTESACRMLWLRAVEQLRLRFRQRKLLE